MSESTDRPEPSDPPGAGRENATQARELARRGAKAFERWSTRADNAIDRHGKHVLSVSARACRRAVEEAGLASRNLRRDWRSLYRRRHAIRAGQESVASCRQAGDRRREALELNALGHAYRKRREHADAIVCYTQALGIFQVLDNRRGASLSLSNLGLAYDAQGNGSKAVQCYEAALEIARSLEDRQIEGQITANLATTYRRQGRAGEARDLWEQALDMLTPGSVAHRELSQHLAHRA